MILSTVFKTFQRVRIKENYIKVNFLKNKKVVLIY